MPNLKAVLVAALAVSALPAHAAILGPHPGDCAAGSGKPAMLVKITGLKARTGLIRVQSYGGDPQRFFEKHSYLERVEVRTPASGPIAVCMPVPAPGTYAISVRHDVAGDGQGDMKDGGGMSGNPAISLMDVVFKRHPAPSQVSIRVTGVTNVPVILNYIKGTGVGPIATAER